MYSRHLNTVSCLCANSASKSFSRRLTITFFFSSRRRHTICYRDWSSDVCSSDLLVSIVHGLESMLAKRGDAPFDEAELQPLLDRAVSALARFGSGTSRRVVVEHGLRRKGGLGDARARLTELAGQDLSGDADLVGVLLRGLKAELPFRVFGLTLKKRDDKIGPIIDALSSTPLPQVKKAFEDIVEHHPGTEFAKAAARSLAAFDAPRADGNADASKRIRSRHGTPAPRIRPDPGRRERSLERRRGVLPALRAAGRRDVC